jgi:hypothetical protein
LHFAYAVAPGLSAGDGRALAAAVDRIIIE